MKYVVCKLCGWNWVKVEENSEDNCPICPESRWGLTYNSDDTIPDDLENLTF